jgi:hypothetical protein
MTDLIYVGATLLFFLVCFGLIQFFDSLSRSE